MVSGAQPIGWTDDRVERLKTLWMEGLSASQIATELGEGVTRNAVIGKVHRLKLSARAKPTNSTPRARPVSRPATTARRVSAPSSGSSGSGGMSRPRQVQTVMRTQSIGATALAVDTEMETEAYVAPAIQELFIPEDKRLSLLQLSEATCKWPIGDPLTKDFYFCGQHSLDSGPYCDFHARRAYHRVDRKKR